MGRIDAADHARLGRFVAETAALPANGEPFSRAFLAALRRLVPCDVVHYAEHDRVQCRLLHYLEHPIYDGPEPQLHLTELNRDDPVRRYFEEAPVGAYRLSDVVTTYELRRSPGYEVWFGVLGFAHQLRVGLDATRWHGKEFSFDRGPGRNFTARDCAVLDAVRPYLAARYALWRDTSESDPTADRGAGELTFRELEVLNLVAEGMTNGEIAQRLWISPGTVRRHLENIYEKLGVHTRTAAVAAARR